MKKAFRKIITIAIMQLGLSANGQSVITPNVNTPTPNASSLGQYGEVPVSMFTGVPNIDIPIYELREGDYKMPVSLSYHYSGNRPNEVPGSTGMGWTLSAGGAIIRVVKGWADEGYTNHSNVLVPNYGFLYNYSSLNANLASAEAFQSYLGTHVVAGHDDNTNSYAGSVGYDQNPDKFEFNFCGISGYFYMDGAGKMRVKSDRDIKVIFDAQQPNLITPFLIPYMQAQGITSTEPQYFIDKPFGSFTLVDEDGTKYTFGEQHPGENSEAIEYSSNWLMHNFVATTWFLTTITLTNGKQIKFNYDRGPFITQLDKYFSHYNWGFIPNQNYSNLCSGGSAGRGLAYSGTLLSPLYLRNVSTSSGVVINFTYSKSNALSYSPSEYSTVSNNIFRSLSNPNTNITYPLSGQNNEVSNNYIFWIFSRQFQDNNPAEFCDFGVPYYQQTKTDLSQLPDSTTSNDYFTRRFTWMKLDGISIVDNFNNAPIKTFGFSYNESGRLKLSQVQKLDNSNNVISNYKFTYNSVALPNHFLTDETDYWGYYNGNGQNIQDSHINTTDYSPYFSSTLKGANRDYGKAELLETITYPTGGTTTFVPSNNDYSMYMDVNNPNSEISGSGYAGGVRISQIINKDMSGTILSQKKYYYGRGYNSVVDPTTLASSGELSGIPQYSYSAIVHLNDNRLGTLGQFNTQPIIPASENSMGSYIGYSEVAEVNLDGSYSIYKYTNYSEGATYQDAFPASYDIWNISYNNAIPYPFPHNDNSELRGKLKSEQQYDKNGILAAETLYDLFQPVYTDPLNSAIRSINGGEILSDCDVSYLIMGVANTQNLFSYRPTREIKHLFNPDGSFVADTTTTFYNSNYKKVGFKSSTASDGNTITTYYKYPFNQTDATSVAMVNNNIVEPVLSEETVKNVSSLKKTTNIYQQWSSDANPGSLIFLPSATQVQIGINPVETRHNYLAYDPFGNLICEAKPGGENISYQWGYNNQYPTVKIENATNTLNTLTTTTNSSGSAVITLPYNAGSQQYTAPVTVSAAGELDVILGFSGNPNISTNPQAIVNCTITGTTDHRDHYDSGILQLCLCAACSGTSSCGNGVNSRKIVNIPQGQYTMTVYFAFTPVLSSNVFVQATYPNVSSSTVTTGIKEFYFQGFEEDPSGVAGVTHTGRKYGTSNFVNWDAPANGRTYVISYWYLSSGTWKYSREQLYTGSSISPFIMTSASAYDDIRIYPKDALMTTYTYDPLVGLTTSTDAKGETTYYEYDSYQRLMNLKDKDGNIIKSYVYHYAIPPL